MAHPTRPPHSPRQPCPEAAPTPLPLISSPWVNILPRVWGFGDRLSRGMLVAGAQSRAPRLQGPGAALVPSLGTATPWQSLQQAPGPGPWNPPAGSPRSHRN